MHRIATILGLMLSGAHACAQDFVGEEGERQVHFSWTSNSLQQFNDASILNFDTTGPFQESLIDQADDAPFFDYLLDVEATQDSLFTDSSLSGSGTASFRFDLSDQAQGAHLDLNAASTAFYFFELVFDAEPGPFRLTGELQASPGWNAEVIVCDDDNDVLLFRQNGTGSFDELIDLEPGTFYAVEVTTLGSVLIDDRNAFDVTYAQSGSFSFSLERATCPADLDGDGDSDAEDFFVYLDLFAAGDRRADLDRDGDIDAEDFFAYLDLFAQGC